jgi:predicted HicB family RNase H-like nuclease
MDQQKKSEIKQLTLRLPADYHRKLKVLAACSGKSMTDLLIECIDKRLKECLREELDNIAKDEKA